MSRSSGYKTFGNSHHEPISENEIRKIEEFEDLLNIVGSNGKYQKFLLYGFLCPFYFIFALLTGSIIFILAQPEHSCHIPVKDDKDPSDFRFWKNLSLPREIGPDGIERFTECLMYVSPSNHTETPCKYGWDYDRTDYTSTIPTKYNWVCDKAGYVTAVFTVQAAGDTVGAIVFAFIGEKFGRKSGFFASCFITSFFLFASYFLANYISLFLIASFLSNIVSSMITVQIESLALELTDKGHRAWIFGLTKMAGVFGDSFLAFLAWITRNWFLLGLSTSLPGFLLLFYYPYVLESPRWLLTRNRIEEATTILEKLAKKNGSSQKFPPGALRRILTNIKAKQDEQERGKKKRNVWSLFSTWRMSRVMILLGITGGVTNITSYAIKVNTIHLAGNEFFDSFLISLVGLPCSWVIGVMTNRYGRRWTATSLFLLGAVGYGVVVCGTLDLELTYLVTPSVLVASFSFSSTLIIAHLQGIELLPTELRVSGNGFQSTLWSIMSIMAPSIVALGKELTAVSYILCFFLSIIAIIASSFLPETLGQTLPETLEDADKIGKNAGYWSFLPKDYKDKSTDGPST